MIDDLITFSRLEAGHIGYHIGPVLADEVLRITQAVIAPLASDHGVTLQVGACAGIFVAADGDKLKQILVNLAANAVKFSDRGGIVRLSCLPETSAVAFRVIDNGPGIDAAKLREIFEPYVQLETPLLDRYGGTGLGLAISREFANGMHGQLTVASTVGRGSEFTLRLAARDARGNGRRVCITSTRGAAASMNIEEPLVRRRAPCLVLVVDDHDDTRLAERIVLEHLDLWSRKRGPDSMR